MACGSLALNGQQFSDLQLRVDGRLRAGQLQVDRLRINQRQPGASTSGTIDGYPATLAVQGNDLVLTVVPEPSSLALLGVGAPSVCWATVGGDGQHCVPLLAGHGFPCVLSVAGAVGLGTSGECVCRGYGYQMFGMAYPGRKQMSDRFSGKSSCPSSWLLAVAFASFAAAVVIASQPVRADVYWTLPVGQTGRLVGGVELGRSPADRQRHRLCRQRRNGDDHHAGRSLRVAFAGRQCGKRNGANDRRRPIYANTRVRGLLRHGHFHAVRRDQQVNSYYYGSLYLGYNAGSSGTYNLSGSGQLSAY